MRSLKFSGSASERGKKLRFWLHLINVIIVTFVYVMLVHKAGAELGVDVNKPLKEYDKFTVLSGFAFMLVSLTILYGISFKIISWLFFKFKI